jgi:hypothetical protein
MKKITLTLVALISSINFIYSQATLLVKAPQSGQTSTQVRAPNGNGTHAGMRACLLITQTELTGLALTNSVITKFGFDYTQGLPTAPAVTGQFTVYLQNTSDVNYTKGLSFNTATVGMATTYTGNMTVPVSTSSTSLDLTLTTPFNYTGGGLYVAYEWSSTGPFNNGLASYDANQSLANGCASIDGTVAPSPNTMLATNFRPVCRFTAANSATNELSVVDLIAPGKVSKLLGNPQIITARIKNLSVNALSSIPVTLNVGGANIFTNSQTIASIAAGATGLVTFAAFNPTISGLNTLSVTIPNDQLNSNNITVWSQSVTCSNLALHPNNVVYNTSYGFGGGSGSGCFLTKSFIPTTCSLTSISCAIGSAAQNAGKQVYGVVIDANGGLLANSTNTITLSASQLGNKVLFNFTFPQELLGGDDYYFGMAQPTFSYYPLAAVANTLFTPPSYFVTPLIGGAFTTVNFAGYFGIEAQLLFDQTSISAIASNTLVCRGASATLNASGGATTYTWNGPSTSAVVSSTAGVAIITPTSTAPSVNYTVNGTDGISGCRTNASVITISLSACVGLSSNGVEEYNVSVFPNPANNGKTIINGLQGTNTIQIYNALGQVVNTQNTANETVELNFENLARGSYVIKITGSNNQSKLVKIIN